MTFILNQFVYRENARNSTFVLPVPITIDTKGKKRSDFTKVFLVVYQYIILVLYQTSSLSRCAQRPFKDKLEIHDHIPTYF